MKVKGILHILFSMMRDGDIALYIDTDVLMNHSHSINDFITNDLNGTFKSIDSFRGIAVCWDYASFWTSYARNIYSFPINTGTLLFRKSKTVEVLMQKWWESAGIPSKMDKDKSSMNLVDERNENGNNESQWNHHQKPLNHALQWPFEQDRLSWIVDTKLFEDDIVLFQEDQKEHPSISNHLTTLEEDPTYEFMINYTKMVFDEECGEGHIDWYHRRVVLDGCDEGFSALSDGLLNEVLDHWLSTIRIIDI